MNFSIPPYASQRLRTVFAAWEHTEEEHKFFRGVSEESLDRAEQLLGNRKLPSDFRALYRVTDGAFLFTHTLNLHDLSADAPGPGVVYAAAEMRDSGWEVPDEIVPFASMSDSQYALWLPRNADPKNVPPVVEFLSPSEPEYRIVGVDVAAFLLAESAFFLTQFCEPDDEAYDILGVPQEFRDNDLGIEPLQRWASPGLPDHESEEDWATVDQMRERYGASPGSGGST